MAAELINEFSRLHNLESLTKELDTKMEYSKLGNLSSFDEYDNVLNQLQHKNNKLKHRHSVIKQSIIDEGATNFESLSIAEHLEKVFTQAIGIAYPTYSDIPVIIAPVNASSKFGDYQCNNAMGLAKKMKENGENISPRDIAMKIQRSCPDCPVIEKIEVAPAGFVNIFISKKYAISAIANWLRIGIKPPKVTKKRVLVDFSSPNIAKQMHVGHLRSTIIGESICRLLEFLQHDVIRINHLGDWGTQFGMLIAHLEDSFPNFVNECPPIGDLQEFYKESKKRFDADEDFKKRAYNYVVSLQSGEPKSMKAWQLICDVSRNEFKKNL